MTDRRPYRRGRIAGGLALVAIGLPMLGLLGLGGWAAWRIPANEPLVQQTVSIETADVERALQLARAHDPRRAIPGVLRSLRLSQHEAELLLNHAAARVRPSRWALQLEADHLLLRASMRLPHNPFGAWVNVELQARQTSGLPKLQSVRLGQVSLPVSVVEWLIDLSAARYGLGEYRTVAALAIQRVRLMPGRLEVVYAWGPDAPSRVLAALVPPREHERLLAYADRLADLLVAQPAGMSISVSQLMPPLFELARVRSASGEDPALENRAALMVLGMFANGVGLGTLLPDRRAELEGHPIRLTLSGRRDFPQHLLTSAALAAEGGGPLADIIGLYKEMTDARGGSGFSFNDMAANRAGTRLGELAIVSPSKFQQRLASGIHEGDFMPDVSDLPEFMNDEEFRRRFGTPGSPAFQRMMSDIEERLGATPLFR